MKVSAKTDYACIAMLELAANRATGEPVRIRHIAAEHGIPSRFLVQILLQLKGAGLVVSTRGATGGYQLARPPEEISLGEVMAVIEGPREPQGQSAGSNSRSRAARVLADVWNEIGALQEKTLRAITLAELVERSASVKDMYYI